METTYRRLTNSNASIDESWNMIWEKNTLRVAEIVNNHLHLIKTYFPGNLNDILFQNEIT